MRCDLKFVAALVLLLTGCPRSVPAQNAHVRWSAVASYTASEFDASTTYAALHGCGCREMNPLLEPFADNASIFFVLGGQAWATNSAADDLDSRGHGRWARALRWGTIGAHVAAGVSNLRGMR